MPLDNDILCAPGVTLASSNLHDRMRLSMQGDAAVCLADALSECSTLLVRSVPPTRYARSGDVSLAFQAFGDGPITIVAVPPLAKNIEIAWECAQYRHYFERVASFSRYVHFDKRGTGASTGTGERLTSTILLAMFWGASMS
jgi:hypothetical protein